ncbi:related to glycerate dehydrogenase [Cephalotrichum gorgonifer]|uniref:Related to glycerate dehydrogenase n=1 Tax=Cephalotrichum gorgonifer TaxID=2041049 RepID=A0AAE8SS91_9PEZI|nr:related to glycerate dehydrogenase [Cephalotrichum gorgonifer]
MRVSAPQEERLLVLLPDQPREDLLQQIRDLYPHVTVKAYQVEWGVFKVPDKVPAAEVAAATILLSGTALPLPEEAPNLKFVQLQSAGANHVLNHPLFKDTDVKFCTANGVHGPQISEWVITTFLAFQHHIPKYLDLQREGKWNRLRDPVEDAVNRRVGILGYGSIGRQVARVSKAMGMDVHAYTLHPRSTPESRRDNGYYPPGLGDPEGTFPSKWFSGGSTADLHAFLSSGLDLVVICLPLTPRTHHLISAPELKVMAEKRTFVSNIARGPVVNTDDLINALEDGTIRGAALDVTDPEPLPEGHALWSAKNLIVTPHISGASVTYVDRVFEILSLNIGRLSEGTGLANEVSRKDGY